MLFLTAAPQANITRDHVTVMSQQNLMLHCMVTGEPRPLVSWTHNNAQISNTSRTQVHMSLCPLLCYCDPWCCHYAPYCVTVTLGVVITTYYSYTLQVMNNGTLLVMRVMPSDRGEYKCAAVNLMGMSVTSVLISYLGDPGLYILCMYSITCTRVVNASIYPLC